MNLLSNFKPYRKCLPALLLLMAAGCGKLDNLDADDFNLFGDAPQQESLALKHYKLPGLSQTPAAEYIEDENDKESVSYGEQLRKVCDYAKMPFNIISLSDWQNSMAIPETARIVCIHDTKKISPAALSKLMDYVSAGGTLFIPCSNEDKRAAFMMGFRPEAEFDTNTTAKGFLFNVPFLPGMKGKTYVSEGAHYGFGKSNFTKNIHVLATSINEPDFPLIYENKIGRGRVLVFNTTQYLRRIDRGLFFAALLKGLEGIPYPIANTSTVFLDDFPSPLYAVKEEPIKSELNLTISDFVHNVWWPDMESLAKKYGIEYSAMICFDYKNKTQPPFLFDQWDENKMKSDRKIEGVSEWLVNDVAKKGHELSLHGYNHVEFMKGEWPNPQFIPTALKAVQKKWQVSNFGPMPVTYVPPSNYIDKDGIGYLHQGMPSIKFLCSVYIGELNEGGAREFDFDPYNDDIYDYPRISSGFYMNPTMDYAAQSMYLYTGIWTHFVHPDDVYQIDRPGNDSQGDFDLRNERNLGWRKTPGKDESLLSDFDGILKDMKETYPQQRYLSAGKAGIFVNHWRAAQFTHQAEDGKYSVTGTRDADPNQYWFVYASYENAPKIEAQLRTQAPQVSKTPFLDGFLFSANTTKPSLTLKDLQYETPDIKQLEAKLIKKTKDNYRRYQIAVRRFVTGGEEKPGEDPDVKLARQMNAEHDRLMKTATIDTVAWNKYARYMISQDMADDVWKMLSEYCAKYPTKDNIMYSKQLNQIIEYPNELTKEKWLSAQLLITPNDKNLLNSYIADFYTPENQEKIRTALTNLLQVDTSFDTYLKYIGHLLAYDPPEALKELANKKPSEEFRPVATDVVWLFANDGQFQKAYEWSQFSDDIDFGSKMDWLIELKNYKVLETEYKRYIVKNQNDYAAKAKMAAVYHDTGRFRDAWILANSLPDTPEKDELRKMLNNDVVYEDTGLQQELLNNFGELFYPEVRDKLTRSYRKEFGDFVAYNAAAETNKKDPADFKNVVSFNHYDSKGNLHSFAATYSTMYKINIVVKDKDNITHSVGGVQYQFTSPKAAEKYHWWVRGRAEYSDYKKFYGQLGLGGNISKEKHFTSGEFKVFPMETGPAHTKMIYRAQLNLYRDDYWFDMFNTSVSLEGNGYTNAITDGAYRIGHSYEGSATVKAAWDNGKPKKMRFIPFVEGTYTQATIGKFYLDPSIGYPYWIIDDRQFGGGGLGWKYGLEESNLQARVDAAYFFDSYTQHFSRFTGELAWQIFDFTQITANFEVYAQKQYYSNAVQFGVKYNLKKRSRKK